MSIYKAFNPIEGLRQPHFFLGAILTLLLGCAATQLMPGGDKVIVSQLSVPQGCKYLGAVVGTEGGPFIGIWTSNQNLSQGALNDLKNKALGLGANFVQLEAEKPDFTRFNPPPPRYGGSPYGSTGVQQTEVIQFGDAYRCDPTAIGLN